MSINSVTLTSGSAAPFDLGLGEKLIYSTPTPRQSLSLVSKEPSTASININAKDGKMFLTNTRLVFVTGTEGDIETFSLDLRSSGALQLSHTVKSPWLGANYWEFLFFSRNMPPVCDGFPENTWVKGQVKFNDGGLFAFIQAFDNALNDVVNNVDIDEELPRYSA